MLIVARLSILCASLLLFVVFFFPLWRIELVAPQYPEGLRIGIWINKVTGDVRNVNVLNHYIGMSKIEPDQILELRCFPYVFGILGSLGLLIGLINRRRLFAAWSAGVLIFALVGLYDFYSWEYRFGHNLSDDAPMKMEESYDPPLIGTKQLLTIKVTSLPDIGGLAFSASASIALLIILGALWGKKRA